MSGVNLELEIESGAKQSFAGTHSQAELGNDKTTGRRRTGDRGANLKVRRDRAFFAQGGSRRFRQNQRAAAVLKRGRRGRFAGDNAGE